MEMHVEFCCQLCHGGHILINKNQPRNGRKVSTLQLTELSFLMQFKFSAVAKKILLSPLWKVTVSSDYGVS